MYISNSYHNISFQEQWNRAFVPSGKNHDFSVVNQVTYCFEYTVKII
jgi:hypothetical protein